jgi:hypothetical protein
VNDWPEDQGVPFVGVEPNANEEVSWPVEYTGDMETPFVSLINLRSYQLFRDGLNLV